MRNLWVSVTLPESARVPMASGAGSPSVPLRNARLAHDTAFRRGTGIEGTAAGIFRTFPPANIGASCARVCELHAMGRALNREDSTWLTCGSVQPPLFAAGSVAQTLIVAINVFRYLAFSGIFAVLSGIVSHRRMVNRSKSDVSSPAKDSRSAASNDLRSAKNSLVVALT